MIGINEQKPGCYEILSCRGVRLPFRNDTSLPLALITRLGRNPVLFARGNENIYHARNS